MMMSAMAISQQLTQEPGALRASTLTRMLEAEHIARVQQGSECVRQRRVERDGDIPFGVMRRRTDEEVSQSRGPTVVSHNAGWCPQDYLGREKHSRHDPNPKAIATLGSDVAEITRKGSQNYR